MRVGVVQRPVAVAGRSVRKATIFVLVKGSVRRGGKTNGIDVFMAHLIGIDTLVSVSNLRITIELYLCHRKIGEITI